MSYESQMYQLLSPKGGDALSNVLDQYSNFLLAVKDVGELTQQIIAKLRLSAGDFDLTAPNAINETFEKTLADLYVKNQIALVDWKIPFSKAGMLEANRLYRVAGVADVPFPQVERIPEVDPFEQIIADFHNLPSQDLSNKLRDLEYKRLYVEAAGKGLLQ